MHKFQAFKKNEVLLFTNYIKTPRELFDNNEYSMLTPDAILLYSLFLDRLSVSFTHNDDKIHFFDEKGDMYIIFKREEMMKKLHIKRSKLDSAIKLLEQANLIYQIQQGKNLPNLIYIGKTKSMMESAKIIKMGTAENQQSRMQKLDNPDCRKSAIHNNYNNINKNNKINGSTNRFISQSKEYENLDRFYIN